MHSARQPHVWCFAFMSTHNHGGLCVMKYNRRTCAPLGLQSVPVHVQGSYTLCPTIVYKDTRIYRNTVVGGQRGRNLKRQRKLSASLHGVTSEKNNRDCKIIVTGLLHLLWSHCTPCHTVLNVSMGD